MTGTARIADPMNRRSMSCTMCAPCPACAPGAWLVMGASAHARHPLHLHTALSGAHRLEPEIDCHSRRRAAAVYRIQAWGDEVHRPAHAYSGSEPCHGPDGALKPERERADIVLRRRGD